MLANEALLLGCLSVENIERQEIAWCGLLQPVDPRGPGFLNRTFGKTHGVLDDRFFDL